MSKRTKRYIKFGVRTFWGTVLIVVISFAVAIQLGRIMFPVLNEYREDVEANLSRQLQVDVSVGSLKGEWKGLWPKFALSDLSILNPETQEVIFEIDSVVAELSLFGSLRKWGPAFRQIQFTGLQAGFYQEPGGSWRVKGLPESTTSTDNQNNLIIDDPLDLFLFGRRISLINTELHIDFRNDLVAEVTIPTIGLENDADFHRLVANFKIDRGEQSLTLIVEGRGDPRNEQAFDAHGYLNLDGFPSEQVLAALGISREYLVDKFSDQSRTSPADFGWQEQGGIDLDLWFKGTASKGLQWHGDIAIEGVPLTPLADMQWPHNITSQFTGGWDSQSGWRLTLADLELRWPEYKTPKTSMKFFSKQGEPVEAKFKQVDLGGWYDAIERANLLPGELGEIFTELKPYGTLSNVNVIERTAEEGYFFLRAQIADGGVHAWAGVPAIKHINGLVESTAYDGHVQLSSEDGFSLNFPRVYHQPLDFTRASGDLRWQVNMAEQRVGLSSGLLRVALDDVAANGYLNLRLPFESSPGDEPEMTLVIGLEQGLAELHKKLVPYTVPEHLYEWLGGSIKSGSLSNGAFIYHGTLMDESELPRVLQLSAQTHDAQIKFDSQWPALANADAHILMDDSEFVVSELSASMSGVEITQGRIKLVSLREDHSAIAIEGNVSGSSQDSLNLLKNSPISDLLGQEIASWQVSGNLTGKVNLLVPLDSANDALGEQRVTIQLSDNDLHIPNLDLRFEHVQGQLVYDHLSGVQVNAMEGQLWGHPIAVNVRTERQSGMHDAIRVDYEGDVEAEHLQAWTERPELAFFHGVTQAKGYINIPLSDSEDLSFFAESDLQGVEVNLPEPLRKLSDEPSPFSLEMTIGQHNSQEILLKYDHEVPTRALISQRHGILDGVSVVTGDIEPQLQPGVIMLSGKMQRGNALLWYDAINAYVEQLGRGTGTLVKDERFHLSEGDPFAERALPIRGHFEWDILALEGIPFKDVKLDLEEQKDSWLFQLSGPQIAGDIRYYNDDRPLAISLQHLYLAAETGTAASTAESNLPTQDSPAQDSGLKNVDIFSLPAALVKIDHWTVDERDFGSIRFQLLPVQGGVAAYDLEAKLPTITITSDASSYSSGAQLLWLRSAYGDTTYLKGIATASDIGDVLTSWEIEKALTSKEAGFDLQIQWPGAPDEVKLETLSGAVSVQLERGRFIRGAAAGENPLVKLIGLLNFDTLARRLRLDFSDLHPEGMGYESVTGNMLFKQGIVQISQPLKVDMPASQLQLAGELNVERELIDAQLVATLPLAGNLTFAAALTGGIPMAVGMFVVGKLFKRQMDKASSIRYSVKGTWDDPEINLENVFDNTTPTNPVKD